MVEHPVVNRKDEGSIPFMCATSGGTCSESDRIKASLLGRGSVIVHVALENATAQSQSVRVVDGGNLSG